MMAPPIAADAPPTGMLCQRCGLAAAVRLTVRGHTGPLPFMAWVSLCKTHARLCALEILEIAGPVALSTDERG